MMPNSPLTGGACRRLKSYATSFIIEGYRAEFGVEVGSYFEGLAEVDVYECQDTGYRFYHPLGLEGDEAFYHAFQGFDWYYRDRWEFQDVCARLKPGQHLLEVGCGQGLFLGQAVRAGLTAVGLELNQSAADRCRDLGLTVSSQLIEEHAREHPESYDVVCLLQVLEHLSRPREMLQDCVRALKPGGQLIVTVPNDESFIAYDPRDFLNMPPHHVGLWTRSSLEKLCSLLGLRLVDYALEPLQEHCFEVFWRVLTLDMEGLPVRQESRPCLLQAIARLAPALPGETLLVVLEKHQTVR